jgi:putative redox protein
MILQPMITTQSKEPRYLVQFTNAMQQADADVLPIKGGHGAGFGPHELLEASLACCINMWIRMQADQLGIPVGPTTVTVSVKRDHPEEVVYEYTVKLDGELSDDQRTALLNAADNCPVRRTLLKKPLFERRER